MKILRNDGRWLVAALPLALLALGGCSKKDPALDAAASATPQSASAVAPIPSAAVATPVIVPHAAVVAAPAATNTTATAAATLAECRRKFDLICTTTCDKKVDASTTNAQKRRIEHDICLGECTRAAVANCH